MLGSFLKQKRELRCNQHLKYKYILIALYFTLQSPNYNLLSIYRIILLNFHKYIKVITIKHIRSSKRINFSTSAINIFYLHYILEHSRKSHIYKQRIFLNLKFKNLT